MNTLVSVVDDMALLFESSLDVPIAGEDLVESAAEFATHGLSGFLAPTGQIEKEGQCDDESQAGEKDDRVFGHATCSDWGGVCSWMTRCTVAREIP